MEELIRIINNEFNPRIKLDKDDIEDLRECIEFFLTDGIDDMRNEIEDLKEQLEIKQEQIDEFLYESAGEYRC